MKELTRKLTFDKEPWAIVYEAPNANWKIGHLQYMENFDYKALNQFELHEETDEIFILQEGSCALLVSEDIDKLIGVKFEPLEINKPICVNRNTWHTHILSKEAKVIVIENFDNSSDNMKFHELSQTGSRLLRDMAVKNGYNY